MSTSGAELDALFGSAPTASIDCLGRRLLLDQPRIMAVLNVTPDSFSDGGRHVDIEQAVSAGIAAVADGADLIDVGGESTRPGAEPVDAAEQIRRTVPVIAALVHAVAVPISIDTSDPDVMRTAIAAGAGMINDIRALRRDGALGVAADTGAAAVLMHMQGEPADMQADPRYIDPVDDVRRFLADRLLACEMAGIDSRCVIVDPGFGFGKTLEHNLELLARLDEFAVLGRPLLVGLSRKAMLGKITGRDVDDRVIASAAAAVVAVANGAAIVRVHDVAATRDALAVWAAADKHRRRAAAPPSGSWRGSKGLVDDDD